MEGDDGIDIGGTPCLWRELALAKFPRLTPLVEAVRSRSTPDPKHSWKALYRVNSDAHRLSRERVGIESMAYRPKTSWDDDYFLTVEFHRGGDILFVASGTGCRTFPLWDQEIDYDNDGGIICKDPLDPRLISRLGTDPFDEEKLRHIAARVLITRLSDLSVVELGTVFYNREDGGDLIWDGSDSENVFLPVGIAIPHDSDKTAHVYSNHMRTKLRMEAEDGTVILFFEKLSEESAGEWEEVEENSELAYLEMHCPWPETG